MTVSPAPSLTTTSAADGNRGRSTGVFSSPYPGLRPFRESERKLYFGRDDALESLETRINMMPLTLLIARSGLGKSSFLTCRLIPHAEQRTKVAYVAEWGSSDPAEIVRKAVADVYSGPDVRDADPRPMPLLVLDQFEDVFKVSGEREALWDTLDDVVNDPEVVRAYLGQ